MSNRPDIEIALDVRSHEQVCIISCDKSQRYHESWIAVCSMNDIESITSDSVVIIDYVDYVDSFGLIKAIGNRGPRLVAFIPSNVEQEKSMRRIVTAMYPWAEVWTLSTDFGKLLVSNGVNGRPYAREDVRDERPVGQA